MSTDAINPKLSQLLGPPQSGEAPLATSEPFHERHRRQRYVMDFYKSKEAVMRNEVFQPKHRVLEAVKLTAWANFRDYAADDKGRPLSLKQIGELAGLDERRTGEAVKELEAEFCLAYRDRIVFVIDDPELERQSQQRRTNGEPFPATPRGILRQIFASDDLMAKLLNLWEGNDPERFQRYQKTNRIVSRQMKRLKRVTDERKRLLEEAALAYGESLLPHPVPGNQDGEIPHPVPGNGGQNPRPAAGNFPDPTRGTEEPILIGSKGSKKLASYNEGSPEKVIDDAVNRSGIANLKLEGNRDRAIRAVAGRVSILEPAKVERVVDLFEADLRQLVTRRENRPRSWGILVSAMEDAIAAIEREPQSATSRKPQPVPIPSIEEQIEAAEAFLRELPNHPNAPDAQRDLERLRSQLSERKPAASEVPHVQKAGQA